MLQFIKSLNNSFDTVMLFGHNHAYTHLANALGNEYIDNVPTSGLVHLTFNINKWSSIEKGTTVSTIFPKHLK